MKEMLTRRFYKPLIDAVRMVKEQTDKNHTDFIEEAIDEKLLRDGYIEKSLLRNDVDNAWTFLVLIKETS